MRLTLQTRVFLNVTLLIVLFAVIAGVLGAVMINRTTVDEAQRGVESDLRSAWGVLNSELGLMEALCSALGSSEAVQTACRGGGSEACRRKLEAARIEAALDFFSVTDRTGRVLVRSLEPYHLGDGLENDPLVRRALKGDVVSGFQVLEADRLRREGGDLEERAFTVFEPTPMAKPRAKQLETSGLALVAAVPVEDATGRILGTVWAGSLLNRNYRLVDRIHSTVFGDATYDGRQMGTVTAFQWDVRIATNVRKQDGTRAVGTRVSAVVYDNVLESERSWYDRAFVVNDWYVTAYDPIRDLDDKTVGILYVGVLAEKYDAMRRRLWAIYAGYSGVAAVVVILVGFAFARGTTKSLRRLTHAAGRLAAGDLAATVPEPRRNDEVLDLTRDFNIMAGSLEERDRRLKAANAELERANESLQQLNANYLDMLGFVSHELKNTLGTIYTAARALNGGLVGAMSEPQGKLVGSICRSIEAAVTMTRNYLDLSRIEKGEMRVERQDVDLVRDVVRPVLEDFEQSIAEQGVTIESEMPPRASLRADPNLLRVVYKNLLDNALKYGRPGGRIRLGFRREDGLYRLEVWNEGEGLPREKLDRLFEKFLRFSEGTIAARRSTGLGLFITKEIIARHGGDIHAESKEGEWLSFVFTLPMAGPADPAGRDATPGRAS